ncbi:MAG: thioredoxin family protein [Spirochaetaceae bacterium]
MAIRAIVSFGVSIVRSRRFLLSFSLLLAISFSAHSIEWESSLPEGRERAEVERKNLLVFVTAGAWCRPCSWMEERALASPEIRQLIEKSYVSLKLYDYQDEHLELPVEAYPSILIYAPDGTLLENIRGPRALPALESALIRYQEGPGPAAQPVRFETRRGSFVYVGEGTWERRVEERVVRYREYDRDETFIYLESEEAPRFLALPPQGGEMWQWDPMTESWEEFSRAEPR